MTTASCSVSQRGAKRFRDEMSKTGVGEVIDRSLDRVFRCCTQGPGFPGAGVKAIWEDCVPGARGLCRETHGVEVVGVLAARCTLTPDLSARDVSSIAFRFLSWACFPSSSWIRLSTASSSSCTECSSNVSSPALKGRHKSATKASNSETMVNVCMCVCVKRVLAVLTAPALALLTGYKLIADFGNQNKACYNKPL